MSVDNDMFDELMSSVQEMDAIVKGEQKASRTFDFPDPEVKSIRDSMGMSQDRFAALLGARTQTANGARPFFIAVGCR